MSFVRRESTMKHPFKVKYQDYPFNFRLQVKCETVKVKYPYNLQIGDSNER